MRVIGHMVTRNELGRYLTITLPALQKFCDVVAVYDDQSEDGTLEYVRSTGVCAARRPNTVPSFAENESFFRQAAWRKMERQTLPEIDDWILCLDADELLITDGTDSLHTTLALETASALTLRVEEVFGFDSDGAPLVRLDGFWGQISATRLVRWRPRGGFDHRAEGGGSVPTEWDRQASPTTDLRLMHLGYARVEDRYNKHERYSATTRPRGHNTQHIDSILQKGSLHRWTGELPEAYQDLR